MGIQPSSLAFSVRCPLHVCGTNGGDHTCRQFDPDVGDLTCRQSDPEASIYDTPSSDQLGRLDGKLHIPSIPLNTSYVSVSRPPSSFCWWGEASPGKCKRYSEKDGGRRQPLPGEFPSLGPGPQSHLLFLFFQNPFYSHQSRNSKIQIGLAQFLPETCHVSHVMLHIIS